MKKFYRGSYIDASCQVWLHLAKQFENLITYLGVIALFSSNFQNVNTFCPLFKKTIRDRC
jgi:hypothetical protein